MPRTDSASAPWRRQTTKVTIRCLLVDDHEVVRRGLVELFASHDDVEVVGDVESLVSAREFVESGTPIDVAVVDVALADGSGIDLCRELSRRRPPIPSVVLTAYPDDGVLIDAHEAGVSAFLLKQIRGQDLLRAVRGAASGARLVDLADVKAARKRRAAMGLDRVSGLSGRERELFDLIGIGASNRDIAVQLGLAEKTVKNYVTNLFMKLGVQRRTEVAALAARIDERERYP